MDLGVQIEPQFGFSYEAIRDIAVAANTAAFTRLWVSDHLFLNQDAVTKDCLDAWTVLAGLARDTEGIRIGPMVSCQSYRNPALLAKIAAGVDQMSGGRLEFGVGEAGLHRGDALHGRRTRIRHVEPLRPFRRDAHDARLRAADPDRERPLRRLW